MTIPNGNMESPVVGAWSTTLPANWTWVPGSGAGAIGLTGTGGANGTQQTLYGNQIAGTLTSQVLPQTVTSTGPFALRYWVKRENSGPFTITAKLLLNGAETVSRADAIATNAWVQYMLNGNASVSDLGTNIQIQFAFSNGSGAWQGYLDEVTLEYMAPSVSFLQSEVTQQETSSTGTVKAVLFNPGNKTVSVDFFLAPVYELFQACFVVG